MLYIALDQDVVTTGEDGSPVSTGEKFGDFSGTCIVDTMTIIVTSSYLTLQGNNAARYTFAENLAVYLYRANKIKVGDIYYVQFNNGEEHGLNLFL